VLKNVNRFGFTCEQVPTEEYTVQAVPLDAEILVFRRKK
jgi:hypothetical protein